MTKILGTLDPESAAVVLTALDARMSAEWANETVDQHLLRTQTQRRVDALVGICRDWMSGVGSSDATKRGGAHVSVIINLDQLVSETGIAVTEYGGVIAGETARRIACDAGVTRIITNGASQIIDVGRETRVFTGAVRKAILLRDQGCRMAGCTAPVSICDVHHVQHWAHGGQTCRINGCCLCNTHHHLVHEGGWTITGDTESELILTSPDGRIILSTWPPGHPHAPPATNIAA